MIIGLQPCLLRAISIDHHRNFDLSGSGVRVRIAESLSSKEESSEDYWGLFSARDQVKNCP